MAVGSGPSGDGQKKVLIIDDDHGVVGIVKDGLESIGLRVVVAFDGVQGVLQAHQTMPDVVLLDFNMPAGGGATVYERLRNSTDTCRIPIVFTTVVPIEEVRGRIRPGPQTYFLKKPVTLQQLRMVLGQVLGVALAEVSSVAAAPSPAPAPATVAPPVPLQAPAPAGVKHHEFEVRVTYADTDKMGVIYYANYFRYFELGRTELMRSLGLRYRDLEADRKILLPVVEARCEYLGPSRYDDLLLVRTRLARLGPASVTFGYEIIDKASADRLVATGYTRHAVVGERWRPMRVPDDLKALLRPYVKP